MKTTAIIAAGGSGSRMMIKDSKMFIKIGRKPVLAITISVFERSDIIDEIVVVVPPKDVKKVKSLVEENKFRKVKKVIPGGATRQDSVYNGIQSVSQDTDIVAIHDGARPFVTKEIILDAVSQARAYKAVIVGVPVKDTIKMVEDDRLVTNTLNREMLWQVQTPQVFEFSLIREAYSKASKMKIKATDDASLVERSGEKVKMIMGSYDNIKITTPEDLILAEAIMRSRR